MDEMRSLPVAQPQDPALLTEHDIYLFREGSHAGLYRKLGCQLLAGGEGARFAVWAPSAREISVIGDWNNWHAGADMLSARWDSSGIWQGTVAGVRRGHAYKYRIISAVGGHAIDKADPFAFFAEAPPARASRAWRLEYEWNDAA